MDGELFLRSLHLVIDPEAHVLVCCRPECLTGLSSKVEQVSSHLDRKHDVPKDTRRRLAHLLRHRNPALQNPPDAPLRSDRSRPDPHLRKLEGFACQFCRYRTISKQNRSRHITECHKETRERLGVRPPAMFLPVYLQAWIRNPPEGRYWVVCEDGNETLPVVGRETFDHLKNLHSRERQRHQSLADAGAVTATIPNANPAYPELRPWLERTGWPATYQKVNRSALAVPHRSAVETLRLAVSTAGGRAGWDRRWPCAAGSGHCDLGRRRAEGLRYSLWQR